LSDAIIKNKNPGSEVYHVNHLETHPAEIVDYFNKISVLTEKITEKSDKT
jgi:hypothetical protein